MASIGDFLGGSGDTHGAVHRDRSPPETLNSSNILVGEYGLHFTGEVDIALSSAIALSPGVQFDMGLTNIQAVNPNGLPGAYPYSDTFWAATATIGVKYTAF